LDVREGHRGLGSEELDSGRWLIAAEAVCAARGERLNAQGRRVLKALLAAGRPLKAYELMHLLAEAGRTPAPPTVYRALRFLIGVGLAHRVESLNAFIACRFPGEAHLAGFHVCVRCGSADEFRLDEAAIPFAATADGHLIFEVLKPCDPCRKDLASPASG
jgi:Fur family zinc uptake transcriptional regulator